MPRTLIAPRGKALRPSQERQVHEITGRYGPLARSGPPPEGEAGREEGRRRPGRSEAAEGEFVKSLKAFFKTVVALIFPAAATEQNVGIIIEYPEMCDPSAAVAITGTLFIVASDEDNLLRVYMRETSAPPQRFDLNSFLRPDEDFPEADIEGGTRIGDHIFWIASHGRNQQGKLRPSRHRLFATKVAVDGNRVTVSSRRAAIYKTRRRSGTSAGSSKIRSGERLT